MAARFQLARINVPAFGRATITDEPAAVAADDPAALVAVAQRLASNAWQTGRRAFGWAVYDTTRPAGDTAVFAVGCGFGMWGATPRCLHRSPLGEWRRVPLPHIAQRAR